MWRQSWPPVGELAEVIVLPMIWKQLAEARICPECNGRVDGEGPYEEEATAGVTLRYHPHCFAQYRREGSAINWPTVLRGANWDLMAAQGRR